jgi:hypothetical protein
VLYRNLQVLLSIFIDHAFIFQQKRLDLSLQGCQRCSQIMGHIGD